jgi:transposase
MTEGGVPIAHEVFPGATADVRSFARVITSLRERFPVGRVIVVSDRGTVSEGNLELLSSLGLSHIWGRG